MQIILLENVFKHYRLRRLGSRTLREAISRLASGVWRGRARESSEDFFALQDVSFAVERGETVGIVGPNGSGKSTVLKLLSRITYPTRGRVRVGGSVASLIQVGAGFHPELTGRENVYLYGAIMGMRRMEVRAKFDQIIDFAEVHRFVDTPVKWYSSGMHVRLGFSVAVHSDPDVLLVDEAFAVGDAAFQTKCLERIEALRSGGMTVVLVSHDMQAIERLCARAFFLHAGQIRAEGDPRKVIGDYYRTVVLDKEAGEGARRKDGAGGEAPEGHVAEIVDVRLYGKDGEEIDTVGTGEPLSVRIDYKADRIVEDPVFEVSFHSADGRVQCQYTTAVGGEPMSALQGSGTLEIICDAVGLMPGFFRMSATLGRRGRADVYARVWCQSILRVVSTTQVRGMFYSPHRWRLLTRGISEPGGTDRRA